MELFVRRIVKFFLFTFSVLIFIYGIILAVYGLMMMHDMRSFSSFLQNKTIWLPYLITFSGIMMMILPVFGFWATQKQNYKLLVTFFISAAVILVIEVAIVTWVQSKYHQYTEQLQTSFKDSFANYKFQKIGKRPLDLLQRNLQCCGVNNPNDWKLLFNPPEVPGSCCIPLPKDLETRCKNTGKQKDVHQMGCYQVLSKRIGHHRSVVSSLAAGAAFALGTRMIKTTSIALCAIEFIPANTSGSATKTKSTENLARHCEMREMCRTTETVAGNMKFQAQD